MLCSNCRIEVRPVVAIDIDGTLGNYHAHLMRFTEAYMGMNPGALAADSYDGSQSFGQWFCHRIGCDMTTFRNIKLAYRQGAQKRSMPAYKGAASLVWSLRSEAEVWLTTTRPYLRLDNVDPDTRFWLSNHSIEFDGMLYDEDKYKILAERTGAQRVVAVLDDLVEQLLAADEIFGEDVPIMRRTTYNKNADMYGGDWAETDTLEGAGNIIKERIRRWNEIHSQAAA